jgi:transcriptional regulator with XRE-family HTH domain
MKASELNDLAQVRALAASGVARSIRESKSITLGEVAESSGIAKSTLSRWERGQRQPTGKPAVRYMKVLRSLMGSRPS